ncbi:GNAT family N-acetyltransferase [Pedobacter sp. ASV1-7]|uniref:GNAT family N-acetyltransferase n=1 Tax=Pedobacter sp. ASV1-7 TaxID=3145237 RepID=UPI0032E8AB51
MIASNTNENLLKITRIDASSVDFKELVIKLDAELKTKNRNANDFYASHNSIEKVDHVVIAFKDDIAVGCGAIKKYGVGVVEIKRMYVLPRFRNRGIALKILNELENWALEMSFTKSILETGRNFPAAITLYLKAGYTIEPNYPPYEYAENSICMSRSIA